MAGCWKLATDFSRFHGLFRTFSDFFGLFRTFSDFYGLLRTFTDFYGPKAWASWHSSVEVIVILDNARYHYLQEVMVVVDQSPRLKLVFLPTYSPELNLIERVWHFFKKKVLNNKYYEPLDAFRKASIAFFQIINQHGVELASLLSGGFEEYHYA